MKYFWSLLILISLVACTSDSKSDTEEKVLTEAEEQSEIESVNNRVTRDQERLDSMKKALMQQVEELTD